MSEFCFMSDIKLLVPDEWPLLQETRLAALKESPHSFLASYDDELAFGAARWRSEFDRGDWYVGFRHKRPVGLLGCTREMNMPVSECFLEYLWVEPDSRNAGVAFHLLTHVIARLQGAGIRRALLWVMDGNDAAVRLYRRVGFVSANRTEPLTARPGRTEELMQLEFA